VLQSHHVPCLEPQLQSTLPARHAGCDFLLETGLWDPHALLWALRSAGFADSVCLSTSLSQKGDIPVTELPLMLGFEFFSPHPS